MKNNFSQTRPLLLVSLLSVPLFAGAQEMTEERTSYHDGVVTTCGIGEGMEPCRDADGETYQQEIDGPSVSSQTNSQLASEAIAVRKETPAQLDETIRELEEGGTLGEAVSEN